MGLQSGAAGQQSSQNLGESNLIASLPSFLNSNAAQMAAFNKAFNPDTGGFQALFNQVTGDINQGANAFNSIMGVGKTVAGMGGGMPGGGGAPSSIPGGSPGAAPSTSLYQGSAGTPAAYGIDPRQNALFQTTGSTFGS